MAVAWGGEGIFAGYANLFAPVVMLVAQLVKRHTAGRLDECLVQFFRPKFAIVDDLGYVEFEPNSAASVLPTGQPAPGDQEKGAIVIALGRNVGAWDSAAGDLMVATAILDPQLQRSQVVVIHGDSYRLRKENRSGVLKKAPATALGQRAEAQTDGCSSTCRNGGSSECRQTQEDYFKKEISLRERLAFIGEEGGMSFKSFMWILSHVGTLPCSLLVAWGVWIACVVPLVLFTVYFVLAQRIAIATPHEFDQVDQRQVIEGSASGCNMDVWVVVRPEGLDQFTVQSIAVQKLGRPWQVHAEFGRPGSIDEGKKFEVMAVAYPREALANGQVLNAWPKGKANSRVITVIRR